jgi:TPR repeat protein
VPVVTVEEARGYVTDYYVSETHSDEDKFSFVEALHFLIEERNDPNDMHNLAWFYAEERAFDLQLKYLEMAAKQEFFPAYEGLGYYWYYGHGGTVDYEKAFHYFSKGAGSKDDYLRIGCELEYFSDSRGFKSANLIGKFIFHFYDQPFVNS